MKSIELYGMRREYSPNPVQISDLDPDPLLQFSKWFDEASKTESSEGNAAALATAGADMMPSVRMVLIKSFSYKGYVFFTNYTSKKGRQLSENNKASLLFFWPESMRQVRIEGYAEKIDNKESDRYFGERPENSRASAILSKQSSVLKDKKSFDKEVDMLAKSSLSDKRPHFWGGYNLRPVLFEFWQGNRSRSHDRFQYLSSPEGWTIEQLYP